MNEFTINVVQDPSIIIDVNNSDQTTSLNVVENQSSSVEVNDNSNDVLLNPTVFYNGINIVYLSGVSGELLHNTFGDLQGGTTGQYYHLSSGQYFNLTTGAVVRPNETGAFYTSDNPSGFITGISNLVFTTGNQTIRGIKTFLLRPTVNSVGVLLSGEATTQAYVTGISGGLQTQITTINDQTGSYYPKTNPSGFITGDVVRPSETGNFITTSQTGAFYPRSNPSGYITGSVVRPSDTGNFITTSQTGAFYASSNPSGFITGVDLSFSGDYYTKNESESRYVNTTGAETILGDKTFHDKVYINNLYVTGLETIVNTTNTNVASNFILLNLTGGAVDGGLFFVTGSGLTGINDSGAILGFDHSDKFKFGIGTRATDLSVLSTIASFEEVTGISGNLQTQISTLNNQTGSYVLNSQTGNFITSSQTGQFYPISNPSGFITGIDLSLYATIDYATGISGELQTQISTLSNATGSYILDSETGVFYPVSNPSGFITGLASGAAQNNINSGSSFSLSVPTQINNTLNVTGNLTVDTNTLFVDSVNNRVGVGTVSPTSGYVLDANGALRVVGNILSQGFIFYLGSQQALTQGTNLLTLGNAAYFTGINYGNASTTVHNFVSGNIVANGTGHRLPNQLASTSDAIITRSLGDLRYLEKNPVTVDTLSHTTEQFEDFDKYVDVQTVGSINAATAFGSTTFGVSQLFGNTISPVGGFTGNDRYTWNGAYFIRLSTASNQAGYLALNRVLNSDVISGTETTFRFLLTSTGATTSYFKIGPVPFGGTGGGDQSLRGGLVYNPALFGNGNLYIAASTSTAASPFTFTTTIGNVHYVDTGFNYTPYLDKWINITYRWQVIGSTNYIRIIIKRDNVTLYDSTDINLSLAPYNTWTGSSATTLYGIGASRKLGFAFGTITYSARQELYIDYVHEKITHAASWTPPSNWNSLRF